MRIIEALRSAPCHRGVRWGIAGFFATAVLAGGVRLAGARTDWLLQADGELIDLPIGRLHYRDLGSGPPVVMVHGLGGQMRNFSYALSERLIRRYRLILLDRPGSGFSVRAPGSTGSLAEQGAFVAAAIRRLDLDRPLLVGHSLGGAVALATALNHPELIGGLALIAPLTQVPVIPRWLRHPVIRSGRLHRALAHSVAIPLLAISREARRRRAFWPDALPDDFEIRGGGMALERADAITAALGDIAGLADEMPGIVARYSELRLPVEIIFGRDDMILDPVINGSTTASQIPGVRLTLCDGGHMLPLTRPDRIAAWIDQTFRRIAETSFPRSEADGA